MTNGLKEVEWWLTKKNQTIRITGWHKKVIC